MEWFLAAVLVFGSRLFSLLFRALFFSSIHRFDFQQQQKTMAKGAKTVAQAFKRRFSRRGIYGRCLFK
jgi:hypothetical protein